MTRVGLFLHPVCSVSAETLSLLLDGRQLLHPKRSFFPRPNPSQVPLNLASCRHYFTIFLFLSQCCLAYLLESSMKYCMVGWGKIWLAALGIIAGKLSTVHFSWWIWLSVFTVCSLQPSAAERQQACGTDWLWKSGSLISGHNFL